MPGRDNELLAPMAVCRVEQRAQWVWQVCGGGVVLLITLVGLAYGFSWAPLVLALCLAALVAGAWAWMRTARTLRAANDRVRETTRGRQSTTKRWARAVRDGQLGEVEPDEALDMLRWAEASAVHARLAPYGLGGLWLGFVLIQVVNLSLNAPPFADGPLARTLTVGLVVGLGCMVWFLHRRHRLRLEAFLRGLDG